MKMIYARLLDTMLSSLLILFCVQSLCESGIFWQRYNVLQRTMGRQREAEAAYVEMRDGSIFASTYDGSVQVSVEWQLIHWIASFYLVQ